MGVRVGIGKVIEEISGEILNYTPQLYIYHERKPIPLASSILVKIHDNYFLITAGHALKDTPPNNIIIYIGNSISRLEGKVKYTDFTDSINNDKIDIAVWKVNKKIVKLISKSYKFFNLEFSTIDLAMPENENYLIVGYPCSRTKPKYSIEKFFVNPFIFHTYRASIKMYKKLNFHPNTNVLLAYRKRKIIRYGNDLIQMGPDLYGMSGCGIWYIANFYSKQIKYFPVGILIEGHSNLNTIVATRLNVITEIIRQKFKINIPKTKIAKINITLI